MEGLGSCECYKCPRELARVVRLLQELRSEVVGLDDGDLDAKRGKLRRQGFGEAFDRKLRGGVARPAGTLLAFSAVALPPTRQRGLLSPRSPGTEPNEPGQRSDHMMT